MTMQLHLLWVILILYIRDYSDCLQALYPQPSEEFCERLPRNRGCLACSSTNGCLTCKARYFFHLERRDMKQLGVCVLSCPSGYYHSRSPDINKCTKCELDCDCDFTGNFCTRCREGQYLHRGKCHEDCPGGMVPDGKMRECVPAEDVGWMQFVTPVNDVISRIHCEVAEWGNWSPCSPRGRACGFKTGEQMRVRDVLQVSSIIGLPCPATSETRECFITRRKCAGSQRREKQSGRKRMWEGDNTGQPPHVKGEEDNGRKKTRRRQRTRVPQDADMSGGQKRTQDLIRTGTQ